VTKRSSKKTQARRSSLKTFIKVANYNHMMPTRYNLDLDLKSVVTPDVVDNSSKKVEARKVGGGLLGRRVRRGRVHRIRGGLSVAAAPSLRSIHRCAV
jgi:large subunit ribosomal protein L27e